MLANTMEQIIVTGAGMTGALCASFLRVDFPSAEILLLDKSRGTGNAMCIKNVVIANRNYCQSFVIFLWLFFPF